METREQTETIQITIDGKEITCRPGERLIDVAHREGIYVPYFCYHPRMDPVGACRMCLVNLVDGPPKPLTACTMVTTPDMVVETQFTNDEVRDAQEGVLEFLLINHPLDCPICDRGGECPLQDQAQDYGPAESRFIEPKRRFPKPVPISSLVNLDRERCILCYRCTRFCEEISGDTLIAVMERGPRAYIYPFEGEDFDSYFSGNTVQICPVGALTSRPYRFEARPWDLQHQETTCNLCASGCAVDASVRVQDGNVVRFSGAVDEDTNTEWLCDKGRYGHAYISTPERLTEPMVRRDEKLQPISWDEAFRVLSQRFEGLVDEGADGRAGVVCGGSLTDEDAYTAQKFARAVLGTNSVDHRLEGGMSADTLLAPDLSYDELLASDRVLLVSCDAREELPIVFLRLRVAATKEGLQVGLCHPRRVGLSGLADVHVAPFPGAEPQVGAAVAAVLGQPVAGGVEVLAAAGGLGREDVRALGDFLQDAERGTVLLGPEVVRNPEAVRAWKAVARTTGCRIAWAPRRSGEAGALAAGAHPGLLPGYRLLDDASARDEVAEAWGLDGLPDAPGLDVRGMCQRARDGGLEALWLVGADVLGDVPDVRLGAEALRGARFVVLQDVQRSDQMEFADLVLPAAAFTERAGTLTDWEGRRLPVHQVTDPPGAARGDYAIFAEAARRLGRPMGCRRITEVSEELSGLLRPPSDTATGTAETVRARSQAPDHEFPLRLHTYRLLYDEGSRVRHTEGIRELTPDVYAEIHPDDARQSGIEDGASVRLWSRHGSLTATARVSDAVRTGVVFVPYRQPGGSAQQLIAWEDRTPGVRLERA